MKFVDANYLPLASVPNVFVLGERLSPPSQGVIHFSVAIPAEYVFLQENKPASGLLDGQSHGGALPLAAGDHQFAPANPAAPVTLFWARAWERGYQVAADKAQVSK